MQNKGNSLPTYITQKDLQIPANIKWMWRGIFVGLAAFFALTSYLTDGLETKAEIIVFSLLIATPLLFLFFAELIYRKKFQVEYKGDIWRDRVSEAVTYRLCSFMLWAVIFLAVFCVTTEAWIDMKYDIGTHVALSCIPFIVLMCLLNMDNLYKSTFYERLNSSTHSHSNKEANLLRTS